MAYFVREWKFLQLVTHIPTLLLLGSYFIVPESVRWLNSKERYVEVKKILTNRAKLNNKFPISIPFRFVPAFQSVTFQLEK